MALNQSNIIVSRTGTTSGTIFQIYLDIRYTNFSDIDIQMYLYTCQKTRKILSDWQILKVSFDSREIDLYDIP